MSGDDWERTGWGIAAIVVVACAAMIVVGTLAFAYRPNLQPTFRMIGQVEDCRIYEGGRLTIVVCANSLSSVAK